jgi:cell division protein FtsQ
MSGATLIMAPAGVIEMRALRWVAGVISALLLLGGVWAARQQSAQPPMRLTVSGVGAQVSAADVQWALADALQQPVASLDLRQLRRQVKAMPWVAEARVERAWPAGLNVMVTERAPLARWGSESLLDTHGVIFTPRPSEIPTDLPQLDGPEAMAAEVLQRFHGLAETLRESGMTLTGLSLDVRGEWVGRLAPGMPVRFGRVDPLEQVALLAGPVRRVIAGRQAEVDRIDLRYTNGFAVRWRAEPEQQGGP